MQAPDPASLTPLVHGETVVYRLFDVGYAIDLDAALARLAANQPERQRPVRGGAQAIQIANLPVTVQLGAETVAVAGEACSAEVTARIYDFGVVSLRARIACPPRLPWPRFIDRASELAALPWAQTFRRHRDDLVRRLGAAIERPEDSDITEDYIAFRVHGLEDAAGGRLLPDVLGDDDLVRLLLGEPRPVTAMARAELLSPRFSYFDDDLAVLTWNAALVVEPVVEDQDTQYVLEFANAQLLELRLYDAILDRELPLIYDATAAARRGFHLLGRRYSRVLARLQTRVADTTELIERVENSLKVTDDVFLARIYAAALEVFRSRVWRRGIDHKMGIVRQTYQMLNAESQARRAEVLELIIVALIAFEIVLAFGPRWFR
jgi:hypothetical protein